MNATVKKFIADLNVKGKSYSAIYAALLTLDYAKDKKEADKFLVESGIEKGNKKNIIDNMYLFLEEGVKSEEEFKSWIIENGSANTLRWIKAHDRVRVLTNKLHEKLADS